MANLLNVDELSEKTGLKVSKIRRFTKYGIFSPVGKDSVNGKSFLYHFGCIEIKLELIKEHSLDLTLPELGKRIQKICGNRNKKLLDMMRATKEDEIIVKLNKEIIHFENKN